MIVYLAASMPSTLSISIMWLVLVYLKSIPGVFMTSLRPVPSTSIMCLSLSLSYFEITPRITEGIPVTMTPGKLFLSCCIEKYIFSLELSGGVILIVLSPCISTFFSLTLILGVPTIALTICYTVRSSFNASIASRSISTSK